MQKLLKPLLGWTLQCLGRIFSLVDTFKWFGIPTGVATPQALQIREVHEPSPVRRSAPQTIHDRVAWPFVREYQRRLSESSIFTLPHGMATACGTYLTRSHKLVAEVSQVCGMSPGDKHPLFSIDSARWRPQATFVPGVVAAVTVDRQGEFFHWMCDVLPRIGLVEASRTPIEKLYVQASMPYQKEALAVLGYDEARIINADEKHLVEAVSLIVPASVTEADQLPSWAVKYLRKKMFSALPKVEGEAMPRRRLYLSRSDATRRCITNEEAVFEVLYERGFEKIVLTGMPLLEQVQLFREAKAVVAPHGAGLTHLLFVPKGTTVLELFSPAHINVCYWTISNQLKLSYHYLLAEGGGALKGDDDVDIDIDKLTRALDKAEL